MKINLSSIAWRNALIKCIYTIGIIGSIFFVEHKFTLYSVDGAVVRDLSNIKVALDPGHGWGGDSGASANGMLEKDITLEIANLAKTKLEVYGIEVFLTRSKDEPGLDLSVAAVRANQINADINISIHVNAGGGTGTESCYTVNKNTSAESQKLARLLTAEVSRMMGLVNRGNFPEGDSSRCGGQKDYTQLYIHDMNSPTALIETAFIDGPLDNDVVKLRDHRNEFAQAITNAILAYFGSSPATHKSGASSTVLVIDVSGSMGDQWQGGVKIDSAKSAAYQIVNMLEQESFAGASHRVGLASFSSNAYLDLNITHDYSVTRTAINGLHPIGGTNIGAGLSTANDTLRQASANERKFIILLSDGMTNHGLSPDEIVAGPVQQAAQNGTCIYTVGFGDQGDIDEDLLRRIASASGCGEYFYATNMAELEKVYIGIRHRAIGNVLAEYAGNISQGQQVEAGTFDVPTGQDQLAVTLHWPGSKLELQLIDPQGNAVDETYPGANYVEYGNLIYLIIPNPVSGLWRLGVFGLDVPSGTTIFDAIVSSRTGVFTPTPLPLSTSTPAPPPPKPPTPPVSSGFSIALVILLLAGGGMAVYIYAINRQRKEGSAKPRARKLAELVIVSGSGEGKAYSLGTESISIGSGPACNIRVPDPAVSRVHALIRYAHGQWFLQDQRSRSGTYVNGQKVTAVPLNSGNRIRIGATEFEFNTKRR